MYTSLLTSLEEGIFTITINRPDKLNALNKDVIADLDKVMDAVNSSSEIKSVIITGAGPKAFVAGADISEFTSLSAAEGASLARKGQQVFDKIENASKPVIAAVNGFALGGGCELALSCHFIIATDNAKFGQPEVNLGLIPGYGGTQRLTQVLGRNRSMQLLMTGEMFSAKDAMDYGMVNEVVSQDKLLERCKEILQVIQGKAPLAIAKVIECVNHFDHTQEGYDFEVKKFGECFATEDKNEGTSAFLEKRKPAFKGK
jgi:enoyl-CoA hydratase